MSADVLNDEYYMRLALNLAASAAGQTGINPVVGCVVVKEGRIVGLGAHLKRGEGHAEVHALNMAGTEAEGATAYVTLEPCSHHGKTPPCSDRLIREKVKRVVVAATDPNPLVGGSGIERLRANGIDVVTGVLADEANALNEAFYKYIGTGLPFVTVKSASTLDGKIAAKTGDSKWITGESAREYGHLLRHRHQAIMVGIGTVLADDPSLTTRLQVPGMQPIRVVVDSTLRLPADAKVVRDQAAPTLVLTTERAPQERRRELAALGVEVIDCGPGPAVDLRTALAKLGEREIGSLLVEGGGKLSGALLGQGLVDKLVLFFAPKIIGGGALAPGNFDFPGMEAMGRAIRIERLQVERFGEDIGLIGYPRYESEG